MYHSPQTTCTVWKMFGNIQRRFKHLNRIKSTIKLEMISFFHYYFAHSMVIAHAHSWSTFKLVGKTLWIKKQKNKKKKHYANILRPWFCKLVEQLLSHYGYDALSLSLSSKCKQSIQFEGILRMNCLEMFNTYCICIRLYWIWNAYYPYSNWFKFTTKKKLFKLSENFV